MLVNPYRRETTLPVNPYYDSGYGYPNLGMGALPGAYHRETILPANPYYSSGYGYPNLGMGAVPTPFGGLLSVALKGGKLSGAISYNASGPGRVGYKLTGPIQNFKPDFIAKAVYVLQAKLFSNMKDVDGKLGPATKRAMLAATTGTAARVTQAQAISDVADGTAPLASVDVNALLGAFGIADAPKKSSGGGGGGGGGGGTKPPAVSALGPVKTAGIGGNMPLILGVGLLAVGGWFLWQDMQKKKGGKRRK